MKRLICASAFLVFSLDISWTQAQQNNAGVMQVKDGGGGGANPTSCFCLGDSLTSHRHSNRSIANGIMDNLGRAWRIVNAGKGGNTTAQMAARFATDVTAKARAGDYVIIWGGVNDNARDVAAATTEANLQAMYTAAQAAGLKVVALTISPWKNSSAWRSGRQGLTDAVNTWIMSGTPTGVHYKVDLFSLIENTPGDDLFNTSYVDADLIHPNEAGIDWIADFITAGVTTWTAAPEINAYTNIRESSADRRPPMIRRPPAYSHTIPLRATR